jgi:hypothetical protein
MSDCVKQGFVRFATVRSGHVFVDAKLERFGNYDIYYQYCAKEGHLIFLDSHVVQIRHVYKMEYDAVDDAIRMFVKETEWARPGALMLRKTARAEPGETLFEFYEWLAHKLDVASTAVVGATSSDKGGRADAEVLAAPDSTTSNNQPARAETAETNDSVAAAAAAAGFIAEVFK